MAKLITKISISCVHIYKTRIGHILSNILGRPSSGYKQL